MLQNMHNAYLRGYEGKPPSKYIKGSLVGKEYKKGKSDREKGLPDRYATGQIDDIDVEMND